MEMDDFVLVLEYVIVVVNAGAEAPVCVKLNGADFFDSVKDESLVGGAL